MPYMGIRAFFPLCNFCGSIKNIIYLLRSKHLFLRLTLWYYVRSGIARVDIASSKWTLEAPTVNIHQSFKHSTTTWSIVSNHRQWIALLQEIFINILNSSNRIGNLSSRGRSTKSERRKKRNCCCYGLAVKASKCTIPARGPTKAMTSRSLQLWRC